MASDAPSSWIEATIATATSVWQAFVVPTALGFFAFYRFRVTNKGQQTATTTGLDQDGRKIAMTYEQQLQAAVLAAGVSEKESSRWLVEEQKRILAQVEADKDEGWSEKDRWNRIGTYCYLKWRDATADLRQARALALALARRLRAAGLIQEDEVPTWPPVPLIPDDIEAISPKRDR